MARKCDGCEMEIADNETITKCGFPGCPELARSETAAPVDLMAAIKEAIAERTPSAARRTTFASMAERRRYEAATKRDDCAWLVERPGPEWLAIITTGQEMWTRDANKAIRFPSEQAARTAFDKRTKGFEEARATEHAWSSAQSSERVTTDAEDTIRQDCALAITTFCEPRGLLAHEPHLQHLMQDVLDRAFRAVRSASGEKT